MGLVCSRFRGAEVRSDQDLKGTKSVRPEQLQVMPNPRDERPATGTDLTTSCATQSPSPSTLISWILHDTGAQANELVKSDAAAALVQFDQGLDGIPLIHLGLHRQYSDYDSYWFKRNVQFRLHATRMLDCWSVHGDTFPPVFAREVSLFLKGLEGDPKTTVGGIIAVLSCFLLHLFMEGECHLTNKG